MRGYNKYNHSSYFDQFSQEAILAIRQFNDEVLTTASPEIKSLEQLRTKALERLNPEQHCQLLNALIEIYPHWFTNGRRDCLGKVSASRAKEVNMQILTKLSYGEGRYIVTSSLGSLASMGGMRMTGGKRKAAVEKGEYRRTGTRRIKAHCQYHPDEDNYGNGLCKTCYSRLPRMRKLGYIDDDTPQDVIDRIMMLPPSRGHGKLKKQITAILERGNAS